MAQVHEIEGVGLVEFPDDATQLEIQKALNQSFPSPKRKALMDEMERTRKERTGAIAQLPSAGFDDVTQRVEAQGPRTPITTIAPSVAMPWPNIEDAPTLARSGGPIIPLPKPEVAPDDSFMTAAGKQLIGLGIGLPEFFESPAGMATVGAGAVAPTATAGYFTLTMAKDLVKMVGDTIEKRHEMSPAEWGARAADIAGTMLLTGAVGAHFGKGVKQKVDSLRKNLGIETAKEAAPTLASTLEAQAEANRISIPGVRQPEVVAEPTAITPAIISISEATKSVKAKAEAVGMTESAKALDEVAKAVPAKPPTLTTGETPAESAAGRVETRRGTETPAGDVVASPATPPSGTTVSTTKAESQVDVTPAIQTSAGDVVTGADHVEAYKKAKETVSPDTSGSKEGFVDATGKFISREEAAAQTGLPTNVEEGKLHSSDLPKTEPTAKQPTVPVTKGEPWRIKPRPDGQPDILDAIQELGGIAPPSSVKLAGGEYDGFKEAFQGPARLLIRKDAEAVDVRMLELESKGYKFDSPGEFYNAVSKAVGERDKLKREGGSAEVQREKFWDSVVGPKSKIGLEKKTTDELQVGDEVRFKIEGASHEPFTVTHIDEDGTVTLKDGPKFKSQELPEGTEIWVKRGSHDTANRVEGEAEWLGADELAPPAAPEPKEPEPPPAKPAREIPGREAEVGAVEALAPEAGESPVDVAVREGKRVTKAEAQEPAGSRTKVESQKSFESEREDVARPVIEAIRKVESLGETHKSTGIATDRGGGVWSEAVDGKFTLKELNAARGWLISNGYTDTRLIRAIEGSSPKRDVPVEQPKVRQLTPREQERLTELTLKQRKSRDAEGEPLTTEERADYDRLMAAKGQMNLLVEEASSGNVERQIADLTAKANELHRQTQLAMDRAGSSWHRRKEFMNEAKQYDDEYKRVHAKIVELRRGNVEQAKSEFNAAANDLFNTMTAGIPDPIATFKAFGALVKLASAHIADGAKTFGEFLKRTGIKASNLVRAAWQQAFTGKATITNPNQLTPAQLKAAAGLQAPLPRPTGQKMAPTAAKQGPIQTPMPQPNPAAPAAVPGHPATQAAPIRAVGAAARNINQPQTARAVRSAIAWMKDGERNGAVVSARRSTRDVDNLLRREMTGMTLPGLGEKVKRAFMPWSDKLRLAKEALLFVRETDIPDAQLRTGIRRLSDFRSTILNSPSAGTKWGKRALEAIDFAEANFTKLSKVADEYKRQTDLQVQLEHNAGLDTLTHPGYVMRAVEHVDPVVKSIQGALDLLGLGDPATGYGGSFLKERKHATMADFLAAGNDPVTMDSIALLEKRLSSGRQMIGLKQWVTTLKGMVDPKTAQPLVSNLPKVAMQRRPGTQTVIPEGYQRLDIAGHDLIVHNSVADVVTALTEPTRLRAPAWQAILKAGGLGKHLILAFDTFHLGRLAYQSVFLQNVLGQHAQRPFSYKKGLTLLDTSVAEINTMIQRGEIPAKWANGLMEEKRILNGLVKNGYNIADISDALYSEWIQKIPLTGAFQQWLFRDYQRGAMAQSGIIQFQRLKKAHPNIPEPELMRMVAKDLNTRYGNLGSQGWFKSATAKDLARFVFLASQWNEGLIKSEFGSLMQTGQFAKALATGNPDKAIHGILMRQAINMVLMQTAANQIINYGIHHKPTWENEDGDAVSALIPDYVGGSKGFLLNPATMPFEITHLMLKNFNRARTRTMTPGDAASQALGQFLTSRAGYTGRAMASMLLGLDYYGEKIPPSERTKKAMEAIVPAPIGASVYGKMVSHGLFGTELEEQFPGQFQSQAMQSFGIKTDRVQGPQQRMHDSLLSFMRDSDNPKIVQQYKDIIDRKLPQSHYTGLHKALRNNDEKAIITEYLKLRDSGKSKEVILRTINPEKANGETKMDGFSKEAVAEYKRSMNEKQWEDYEAARAERKEMYRRLLKALRVK